MQFWKRNGKQFDVDGRLSGGNIIKLFMAARKNKLECLSVGHRKVVQPSLTFLASATSLPIEGGTIRGSAWTGFGFTRKYKI